MTNIPLLSLLILFPFISSLIILSINKNDKFYERKVKEIGLWSSLITFFLSLLLLYHFDVTDSNFQFTEIYKIIPDLGIYYYLGVDGISLSFILLTTFLIPICIITSWNSINKHINYFIISFLMIEFFLIGLFSSLDLFIFYIFFEGSLIPLFLIIGIWGGSNRIYAAYKFFLYTLFGSLFMLLGILVLYFYTGTSNYTQLFNFTFQESVPLMVNLGIGSIGMVFIATCISALTLGAKRTTFLKGIIIYKIVSCTILL